MKNSPLFDPMTLKDLENFTSAVIGNGPLKTSFNRLGGEPALVEAVGMLWNHPVALEETAHPLFQILLTGHIPDVSGYT